VDETKKTRLKKIVWLALPFVFLLVSCFPAEQNVSPTATARVSLSPQFLFDETDAHLVALEIEKDGRFVSLQRGADGRWVALSPPHAVFSQGTVEAAVAQLRALPLLATNLALSPADVGVGTQAPAVFVRFADGQESVFRLGDLSPSGRGYYVLLQNGEVVLIDKDSLDVFFRLVDFF
jgi:hypothetical protein